MSLSRDIASFLLTDQMVPLKFLILGQMDIERVSKDLTFGRRNFSNMSDLFQFLESWMNYGNLRRKILLAASLNLPEIYEPLLNENVEYLNAAMRGASYGGDFHVVESMAARGANDFNSVLEWACDGSGRMDIIDFAIARGVTQFNHGLFASAGTGKLNLVQYMIEKGATSINKALEWACHGEHFNVIDYLIEKGANNFDIGLDGACLGGHLNVAQYMVAKGADNFDYGLIASCHSGHLDIAQYMVAKGATDFNNGLSRACQYGHLNLVQYMVAQGANNFSEGIHQATNRGHTHVVEYLESIMPPEDLASQTEHS